MAILFSDGFDYYNATSGNNNELINISTRYPGVVSTWASYFSYSTGYSGGQSLVFNTSSSTSNSVPIPIGNTLTSITMGAHIYLPNLSNDLDIFTIKAPNGAYVILSSGNTSGFLATRISASGSTAARYASIPLSASTWWYVELHAEVTSTNQILVNVYLNGTNVFTFTGTGFSATPYYWSSFTIGKATLNNSGSYRMDNFYLSDGEVLGPINISTLVPDGDTLQKDGIPINGTTNYNMVNDISSPTMDSNVLLKTDLATDYYTVGDLSLVNTNDTVVSVQGISYSTTDDISSTFRSGPQLKSLSTEATDSIPMIPGFTIPQIATTSHVRTDPNTGSPWSTAGVNNVQLGIRRYDNFAFSNSGFYIDNNGNYPTNVNGSTIVAGDSAPSLSGNALVFNGSQAIRYTDQPNWHVTIPFSAQFEFYTSSTNTQTIFSIGQSINAPVQNSECVATIASNVLYIISSSDNTTGFTRIDLSSTLSLNTWYKVGIMIYSGRFRGYLNDIMVSDVALTGGTVRTSTVGFSVGSDANLSSTSRYFIGGIRKFSMANQQFWPL